MTETILELKDLLLAYPGKEGARIGPVSADLYQGEALGLVGESGAGKSTIGLEIVGLLSYKGAYRLGGEIVTQLKKDDMAYIPQDPLSCLDPLFSIGHQLREIASYSCKRRGETAPQKRDDEIRKALASVHLSLEKISLKSYPHELSGGMRQRLVIAMVLLCKPRLIIADEPTSSLDVILQAEIMKLFGEIRRSGITFLFITHKVPLAAQFCDRVLIMQSGKMVEAGRADTLFRHPKQKYTQMLVESVPRLEVS